MKWVTCLQRIMKEKNLEWSKLTTRRTTINFHYFNYVSQKISPSYLYFWKFNVYNSSWFSLQAALIFNSIIHLSLD